MTCDKCGYCDDRFALGTDEHGVACGWQTLCEACRRDVLDGLEAERERTQPTDPRRDAGRPPARETRGEGINPGHPQYSACYRPGKAGR